MADDSLSTYRAKRSPDRTPEPFGGDVTPGGNLFVVHKHAASHLHFDLRLEMDGVLKSWAVPRGPSYDQADKRLAVRVEDHPLEYGEFEGIIPAGNYGAGGVIVWDRGEWVALEDWREGLEKGKLLFELKGYKLHGKWTLVKIKKAGAEKEWLLIKERDSFMKSPGDVFPEESVLSGLTVEQVKAGVTRAGGLRDSILAAGATESRVDPRIVEAMHAEPRDDAFTKDGWIFELKLDGYRLIAAKRGSEALLLTRNGNDYTEVFPEVARAIKALPVDSCILDGEVVVNDEKGLPSFARLQRRGRLTNPIEVRNAAVKLPALFYVFDLLAYDDLDLRSLPLTVRKSFLPDVIPNVGPLKALDHVEHEGIAFMESVKQLGLEGIIAKKADSKYVKGRSQSWLKIKAEATADFVIVGYTAPQRSRTHFGALQLADYVNGALVYAGRVGTGFNDSLLKEIFGVLEPITRADPMCAGPIIGENPPTEEIPESSTTTWVEPSYVCEVRFREWTPDGLLRHAAFLRLRDDKSPRECERQWNNEAQSRQRHESNDGILDSDVSSASVSSAPPEPKVVKFTNLSKIYWPEEKYTKGDLIEYYRAISPRLLPYLKNRPVVLTRFPDGIDGKSFYQKDAPEFAPSWIRTESIWSEDTQRFIRYFVCDDVETLEYLANLGTIPLHIWNSRCGSLELPDWCVIDLDPKEAPFSDVIKCALALKEICDSIGMPAYVKTTGKTGLHILLPLGRQFTYEQCRTIGELIARLIINKVGNDLATITRHVTKRGDKVYLDYLQNRHGQLIVSPFSVRPLPGASVSMPLEWSEVTMSLNPRDYTIKTAIDRMDRLGKDPVIPVLSVVPDLADVLEKLASA